MANYTPNYGLHQWEPDDQFLRTDFNQDFSKIDEALKKNADDAKTYTDTKASVAIGSYVGSGSDKTLTVDLGFYPQAVLLECQWGSRQHMSNGAYGGLALRGYGVGTDVTSFSLTTNGFKVSGRSNDSSLNYRYIAFR